MNFVTTTKKNKKGQPYSTRPTKLANGLMKHYGNKGTMNPTMQRLAVRGTLDPLAITKFDRVWITIAHPTDFGYTKKVMVLRKNKNKFVYVN